MMKGFERIPFFVLDHKIHQLPKGSIKRTDKVIRAGSNFNCQYFVDTYENETDSSSVWKVCPFVFLADLHGCAS